MKEQAIKKINTIGKISYILSVIAKCIAIVGLVVSLLGMILCFTTFADKIKIGMTAQMDVEMDCTGLDVDYEVLEELDDDDMIIKQESVKIGNSEVGTIVGIDISDKDYKFGKIEIKDDILVGEFESEEVLLTAKDMGIALLLISLGLVMTIVTISFVQTLCKEFRDCATPFDNKVIKKMQNLAISLIPWTVITSIIDSSVDSFMQGGLQLSFNIDLVAALAVLIVFVLVSIFKYGAMLQKESDETL